MASSSTTDKIGVTKANFLIVKSEENWFIAGNIGLSVCLVLFLYLTVTYLHATVKTIGKIKMSHPSKIQVITPLPSPPHHGKLSSTATFPFAKVTIVEKFVILYCEKTSFLLCTD